ncbi:splicing factor 3B subunit 1-like, partial [Trifolium medium]|nr:splicing factor 3B subunit 1-like [Trifolium medium]
DLYGASDRSSYLTSIPATEDAENLEADNEFSRRLPSYTGPKSIMKEIPSAENDAGDSGLPQSRRIIDREDDY